MDAEEAKQSHGQAGRLYREGRYGEALSLLNALERAFPGHKDIMLHRALCLWRTGEPHEAYRLLDDLHQSHGDGPWVAWKQKVGKSKVRAAWVIVALALMACVPWAILYGWSVEIERRRAPASPASQAAAPGAKPDKSEAEPVEQTIGDTSNGAAVDPLAAVEELLRDLHNPLHTNEAYAELSHRVTHDHLPLLHRALETKTYYIGRARVARLLGHLRHHRSVAPLRHALESDGARHVRRNAAWALGRIGAPLSAKDLDRAMRSDPDASVRVFAAAALHEIKGMAAHPLLEEALQTEGDSAVVLVLRWLLDTEYKRTRPPTLRPGEIIYASCHGTLYKLYVPSNYADSRCHRVLVSVHGTSGTPEAYLSMCCDDADKHKIVVVAPFFDAAAFLNYDLLCFGLDSTRSDLRLLEILDAVAEVVHVDVSRFWLFGHSKGGQFVTRFVLAHPDRILAAAACAPGSYVMPDPSRYFPQGIKPHPMLPESASFDFGRLVQTHLAVVVGTNDLPRRQDAADRFMSAVRDYASEHGVTSNVQFISVPEGGHSGKSNYPAASKFLFSRRP